MLIQSPARSLYGVKRAEKLIIIILSIGYQIGHLWNECGLLSGSLVKLDSSWEDVHTCTVFKASA